MMMFLSILCASGIVLAVLVTLLEQVGSADQPSSEMRLPSEPRKFFGADAVRPGARDDLAVDLMLMQIERHVRQEQAAAEAFLAAPTREALSSRSAAPPIN